MDWIFDISRMLFGGSGITLREELNSEPLLHDDGGSYRHYQILRASTT